MPDTSNSNEMLNPGESASNMFGNVKELIEETGNYAKKTNLTPHMSFALFCVLIYFVFLIIILCRLPDFATKSMGVAVSSLVIVIIIYMTFEMHKEELRIQHRFKKSKDQ